MKSEGIVPANQSPALLTDLVLAKSIWRRILDAESDFHKTRDLMLAKAWELGQILSGLKEKIGHGKWLFWLGGHWPELGERNSQRCMAFFQANRDWKESKSEEFLGFELDSVRKFMWGYVPAKDRPDLPGNVRDRPSPHYLTFVNNFNKWDRQMTSGQVPMADVETFREEMERPLKRIIEIGGAEWATNLIEASKTEPNSTSASSVE